MLSDSESDRGSPSNDHVFLKPEITTYPKVKGRPGGYPPTEVPHEKDEEAEERRQKGYKFWLKEVVTSILRKELRDRSIVVTT